VEQRRVRLRFCLVLRARASGERQAAGGERQAAGGERQAAGDAQSEMREQCGVTVCTATMFRARVVGRSDARYVEIDEVAEGVDKG
jgi:hypothetical protein